MTGRRLFDMTTREIDLAVEHDHERRLARHLAEEERAEQEAAWLEDDETAWLESLAPD